MLQFSENDCLWYRREASFFEEALPLGNGTLGAMVWGGATKARIGLNHDTFWTGCPSDGLNKADRDAYLQAQRLALDGKFDEAQDVLQNGFCVGARHAAYQPIGDVYLECCAETVEDYQRALFLREAIAEERFVADGVAVERECFVSYPDRVFCWHVTASAARDFALSLTSPLLSDFRVSADGLRMTGEAPLYSLLQIRRDAKDESVEGKRGMRACVQCAVRCDGTLSQDGARLLIKGASDLYIYLSVETSYAGFDKDPQTEGRDECAIADAVLTAALAKGYDAMRADHIADVSRFYDRVYFSLGSDGCAEIPTDERITRHNGGKGAPDAGLYALKFNYGRYLTIAASREGSCAMNLQGIWCDQTDPAWSSNYTLNINLQMNYFPTLAVGLTEMTEPLDRLIEDISVHGRKTAEVLYGARGFVCHHNSDIWAHTAPIKGEPLYSFWPFGSGWLCHHLFEKYEYTQDSDYLARVYPILREAARFYLDILVDVDGYRAFCPATSPENFFIFKGRLIATAKTTAMSMQIARELFENCMRASEILGISDDVTADIQRELPRMMPTRLLSDGRLEEWYLGEDVEYPENEKDHLHISHLYALYPANAINESTPALRDAARKTLDKRDAPSTGWSLTWKADCYARLGDGDEALRLLQMQLSPVVPDEERAYGRTGGTYPNLFDVHPPFQIDGNFGYVSALCEMLVQSEGEEIKPLPALPSSWKNGEVRGLRVIGNRTVDLSWERGVLTDMKVYKA
ncbi:MAG: glycoside hydrolase family 95 protein [Clostridia bacterium]|nr:glycoside hydrolase family 95 protein [Clostridia bacterium]